MAKEPHSAIPSWSGYIYQGKIAFYEVLRVIKKKLKEDVNHDFSNYSLEVEWEEDFAIKLGDNYKSIHQVKAYAEGTSPTQYNDALEGLYDKLDKKVADIGFLNLWKPIGFTRRTESKNFEELKKNNKSNTPKLIKICKSKKTKWLYDIPTSKKTKLIGVKSYPLEVIEKVKIYKYCTNNYTCDLDEADRLILAKIEEIYREKNFGIESLTTEQYKYIIFKLYELLDRHILEVHKGIKYKNDTMEFNEILEFFKTNYEEYSLEYQQIKVKNYLFLSAINEYCNDSRKCSLDICDRNCSLYKVEKEIENMSTGEVHQLVLNATPQYDSKFDILTQVSGLKNGLIKTYHQLNLNKKTLNFHYQTLDKTYLPSSIAISDEYDKADISKKIILNKDLDSIVNQFEINVIISHNATIEDITKEAKSLKDVSDDFLDNVFNSRSTSINKIKNIKILPLNNIKEEINNAD